MPSEARITLWENLRRRIVEDHAERVAHSYGRARRRLRRVSAPVPVIAPLRAILTELRAVDGNPLTGPILRGKRGKPLNLDNLEPTSHQTCLGRSGNRVARLQTATALAKDNGLAAKALLPHSTLATTDRTYIQAIPAEILAAMKELERQFADCDASVMQTNDVEGCC